MGNKKYSIFWCKIYFSVEKQEGVERKTPTLITISLLNKCKSTVQPTTGMTQACCNRNIEMDKDIKVRCQ